MTGCVHRLGRVASHRVGFRRGGARWARLLFVLRHLSFVILAVLLLLPCGACAQPTNLSVTVVELEGWAQWARSGADDWNPAKMGDVLGPGDRFRTLERARAVLRLSDLSVLRLGELSFIEIPAPTSRRGGIQFLRGLFYYFHRDKPGVLPVTTPSAHAVVLGTEFVLTVSQEGATALTLLDGVVELTNSLGQVRLQSGESARASVQSAPARVPVVAPATAIQWILYYPGVLDLAELPLSEESRRALASSLAAYGQGDLLRAMAEVPFDRTAADPAEAVYLASLQLISGRVTEAAAGLVQVRQMADAGGSRAAVVARLAGAVRRLIELVRTGAAPPSTNEATASEWLVESFARQARSDLSGALWAARNAVEISPGFAFGWAQCGELEFAHGRTQAAREAVERSLALAPRHARAHVLSGFLEAARSEPTRARESFERALSLNGAMGDAWLGRGLCRLRAGDREGGRADLQTAVAVEPQRAILRSYLAKAYADTFDPRRARQELDLARRLDAVDPTGWLYSALLHQQRNEINRGIDDLERSKALNDQRSVFRSRLLLDQDQAVRGANLAALYRDAGLTAYSAREASTATDLDYANHSAHLFLANSQNALRDPNLALLRYETPAVSEYLVANLLAPVGGSGLAPQVSQQEYPSLFDRNRIGLTSDTRYSSDGAWAQNASHYGVVDRVGYALEANWRRSPGHGPNTDLEQFVGAGHFKVQLAPRTSLYVLTSFATVEAGDTRPYYDERQVSPGLRVRERQEPNVFAGVHHQWAPGIHTLFLGAHLNDTLWTSEPNASVRTLVRDSGGTVTGVLNPADSRFGLRYRTALEAWSAELLQLFQTYRHLWLVGGRYQSGELRTRSVLDRDPLAFPPVFTDPAADQSLRDPLDRVSGYGYWHWQILDQLRLIGGGSYDWLRHPVNFDAPPVSAGGITRDQWSPKAGLVWSPLTNLTLRGAYTRSLGGLTYDNSVRLEPTQLAGFIQSYRSLVPESRAGLVPGTAFETFHLGLDHRFPTRTYVVASAELLRSDGSRRVGGFDYTDAPPFTAVTGRVREKVSFEERAVTLAVDQLIGEEFALSARYRVAAAELQMRQPAVPVTIDPSARTDESAWLHEIDLGVRYHHRSGFFARGEARWRRQDNRRDASGLRDADLWQFDLWAGWRLAQRRLEASIGLLNLSDRNYRLNPLNATMDLPRERMVATQLRFNF